MEFKANYFPEKVNYTSPSASPQNGKINVINPHGSAAVVTLWSKIAGNGGFWEKLKNSNPPLLDPDSPIAVVSNLYGNGLPQMLSNLAYNPQIQRIAVTGGNASGSAEALANFFQRGVKEENVGRMPMLIIEGTQFPLPLELHPSNFKHVPEIVQFRPGNLEEIGGFVSQPSKVIYQESDRVLINIPKPVFKDFPSDITSHNIVANSPLEAWMAVMHTLDRFGVYKDIGEKGKRRALFNLDVNVLNPAFEDEGELRKFGFDPAQLKVYRQTMLDPDMPSDKTYTYGNRMRAYFGLDALAACGKRLKLNPKDRHSLVSLWNTSKDLVSDGGDSSSPCFTDAYFVEHNGKLMMSASFRTHNAVSAWLTNIYGLRAIQEEVARYAEMQPGQINVRSRWIGIDPDNAKTISALELIKQNRRTPLTVNDTRGYFVVGSKEERIVVEHYAPDGRLLNEYKGSPQSIKDSMRHDCAVSDTDHAMWLGYNLAIQQLKLTGRIEEF